MSSPITGIFLTCAGLLGFTATWTALDFAEPEKQPGIEVTEIAIYDDGSTFYDRSTIEGKWLAWSGQVFTPDAIDLVCRGGDTSQYFGDENPLGTKDVNWLVSDDCGGNMQAGQKFVFTWTSIDNSYGDVRFPATGYGTVKPASEKEADHARRKSKTN